VAKIVSAVHSHDWGNPEEFSFHQCLNEMDGWYVVTSIVEDAVENVKRQPLLLLVPLITGPISLLTAGYTGVVAYKTKVHRDEMLKNLEFVVSEINSIYKQTQAIMIANMLN